MYIFSNAVFFYYSQSANNGRWKVSGFLHNFTPHSIIELFNSYVGECTNGRSLTAAKHCFCCSPQKGEQEQRILYAFVAALPKKNKEV